MQTMRFLFWLGLILAFGMPSVWGQEERTGWFFEGDGRFNQEGRGTPVPEEETAWRIERVNALSISTHIQYVLRGRLEGDPISDDFDLTSPYSSLALYSSSITLEEMKAENQRRIDVGLPTILVAAWPSFFSSTAWGSQYVNGRLAPEFFRGGNYWTNWVGDLWADGFIPQSPVCHYNPDVQDLSLRERFQSMLVDITYARPGGYSSFTNEVLVDFWTQDGGDFEEQYPNLPPNTAVRAATAGEDYKAVRGTFTFPYRHFFKKHWPSSHDSCQPIRYETQSRIVGSLPNGEPHYATPPNAVDRHTQSVFIPIYGDSKYETHEYFEIYFRVRGEERTYKKGILIINDDPQPAPPPPVIIVDSPGLSPIPISPPPTEEIGQRASDLRFTSTSLSLAEGESATYQVRATADPAREMIVNIATAHSGITVNPSRLTFYSHNWQTFQTVTVTASADAADINEQASIQHSIPASDNFIANNNAGIVSVSIAHTIVEEEESQSERGIVKQLNVPPTDYDLDDDGLIEISNLEQLNAVRWDLNGDGQPDKEEFADAYSLAFPGAIDNPQAQGYELAGDLDFGDNPTSWESIGVFSQPFQAVFEGNNHVIVNLFQDQSEAALFYNKPSGLFGAIGHRGQVVNLGMEGVQIKGVNFVGALAGFNQGSIGVCSALGRVEGVHGVGGLVGQNFGDIRLSIAEVEVQGVSGVGDLVGIDTMAR